MHRCTATFKKLVHCPAPPATLRSKQGHCWLSVRGVPMVVTYRHWIRAGRKLNTQDLKPKLTEPDLQLVEIV